MFSVVDNIQLNTNYRICNILTVASFAIVVTDYIICLPQELELIWPTRWSTGKLLYIASRYSAFLDSILLIYFATPNHSIPTCNRVFTASTWISIIGMFISETVLVFRTWAVWEQNTKLFIILLSILVGGAIFSFVLAQISLSHVEFGAEAEGYSPGCWLVVFVHPTIILGYITILSFESIILGLTLYKCRQAVRSRKSNLLITLHRDAILYCFLIAVCSLANIINQAIPSADAPSFEELQRVMHSVLTARILLNLRQAVRVNELKLSQSTLSWDAIDELVAGNESSEADGAFPQNNCISKTFTRITRKIGLQRSTDQRPRSRQIRGRRQRWNVSESTFQFSSTLTRYLSTYFSMGEGTWTHDEENARRLESEERRDIEMIALRSAGPSPSATADFVTIVVQGPSTQVEP